MMKKKIMVIILSIILLTGCNLDNKKYTSYNDDYTNVVYKTNKDQDNTTKPTTTTTTTTTNTTTTSTSKASTSTTRTTTTTTAQVKNDVIEVKSNNDTYTGKYTSEYIEEAKAYIVKYNDKIKEMIELINIERAKAGLSPVKYDYDMTLAATIRALEMRDTGVFEHARQCPPSAIKSNGEVDVSKCKKCFSVLDDLGIKRNGAGENIAIGYKNVHDAMYGSNPNRLGGFMGSPSHKDNILKSNYKYVGIGIAEYTSSTYYIAQEFRG